MVRSGGDVGQPDNVFAERIAGCEAERWWGSGEEGLAASEYYGAEIEAVLVDQAGCGEALCEVWAAYGDLAG